jgi:hypothetical protein
VLTAKHLLDFARFHVGLEQVERLLQIIFDRLSGLSPFHEHTDVVCVLAQTFGELPVFVYPAAPLKHLLRVGLVVPEVGRRSLRFYLRELGIEAGDVKDSSADRPRASRGPGSV